MDWLMFKDGDRETPGDWEKSAMDSLGTASPDLAGIELRLPSADDAAFALSNNLDMTGSIAFSFTDGDRRQFEILLPYHGVFVTRGTDAERRNSPQRMVWSSWFGEMPGLRRVRSPNGKKSLRLGLPDGRFIAIDEKRGSLGDIPFVLWWAGFNKDAYGEDLLDILALYKKAKGEKQFAALCDDVAKWAMENGVPETDADDIGHRMAVTFPVWLRNRLQRLCHGFLVARKGSRESWKDMARALVPATAAGRQRFTCFDVIHPDNILEAAGRICGIRRFHLGRKTIGFMPAEFRQNHPSFEGRICPIESPESEMVGIQLQLARGASVDVDGRIVPSKGQPPYVSWCTSLIPFLHHNDDARSMMGAKNLRQGVPVSGAEPPCVKSGGEAGIVEFMRPLESAGLCPRCSDDGELKIGRDLLVAYLPWYGWNLDDAVVVSDDVVKKMAVTEEKDHAIDIMPEWRCTQVLQEGGILREGTVIAEFKEERGGKDHVHSIKYVDAAPARLLRIDCPSEIMKAPGDRVPGLVCRLRYRIAREFVLEPGDKLMGRHGNKGVVSMVLPKSEMPRLPDGTTVDILLNPHGVLSRMNPGQLLETHLGWLFHKGKTDADVLAKDAAGPAGCPCRGAVDHEKVKRLLKETGLDEFGKTRLRWTLPNGRKVTTASSVVVGYQHFFRLHHIPALKAQARRGGADAMYSCATGQAAHGRLIGGGQRVGEMEMWALSAYPGTEPIIADLLRNSDAVAVKGDVAPEFGQTGFSQVFSDYLAAMLIKMEVDKKRMTVSFSRMTDEDVLRRAGEKGTITKASSASVRSAQYRCPTHADRLAFGGIRFKWSGKDRRTTLSLASMLSSSGISVKSPLRKVDNGTYRMDICGAKTDHLEARPLWAKKREAATTLSLEVNTSALGVKGVGDIRCYFKRTARAGEVLRRLCLPASDKLAESIGDARVLCPCEDCAKSKPQEQLLLQAADTQGEMSEGGVCDPEKFGTLREAFVPAGEEKWGVIVLPIPVGHIADETSGQPKLSCVPVPPLRYRVGYEGNADPFGYGNIVSACERYCKAKVGADEAKGEAVTAKAKKVSAAAKSIETAARATFGALLREFTGKYGLVRRDGLGRRVDRSCRMVITPGPDLAFDEVGVPAAVLWELMADRIVDERVKIDGKGQSVDKRATAHGVTAAGFGWRSPKESSEKRLAEKEVILKSYLEAYPHWMLLNRQPSLHKHSMQAFRVKVLGPRDGEVFRLQPLSCKGFGADFDGDEMAGYLPLSATAQKALPGLAPSRNLFAAGDGQPTPNFDRDFVMGAYLLSGRDSAAAKEDLERLCRKGDAKAVLKCARDAFARCTEEGVSFGYYDLAAYDGKNGFVADMVRSRANGAGQIRQFVKARGRLETGALGFVPTGDVEAMFDIRSSLVEGMAWEDIFWSSFNARASMCDKKLNTAKAGDLTRRLVYALRPLTISCSKCGCPDGKRSVLACRCKDGLCAECYGTLPDGTKPKRGYPAGLVAAQSIGERGTQLSMKSAHVGRSQIDIDSVRRLILDGGGDKVKRYRDFLKRLPEPYHSLDERHLQLLWRVLKEVEGTSLQGALDAVDGRKDMESVARRANMDTIASFLLGEVRDVSIDTPSARVMFANFKEEK